MYRRYTYVQPGRRRGPTRGRFLLRGYERTMRSDITQFAIQGEHKLNEPDLTAKNAAGPRYRRRYQSRDGRWVGDYNNSRHCVQFQSAALDQRDVSAASGAHRFVKRTRRVASLCRALGEIFSSVDVTPWSCTRRCSALGKCGSMPIEYGLLLSFFSYFIFTLRASQLI